ncbi:protein kinase domain-containing protein [Sulfurimonas sp. CS5]|uniref:protein kinase domain-containing protein n=1 Tax=Sulfurimonas sp. CS5 TaxID=3391145 RepID=UPI0039EC9789
MSKDKNLLFKAKLLKIRINNKVFKLKESLSGNGALSFRYTNIKDIKENIFVKFLISPRNEIELYKFNMESALLEYGKMQPVRIYPKILKKGKHKTLPIYYYVTEWVNGQSLKDIIASLNKPSLDDILEIVHRCSSSAAYMSSFISHRDFHPGNIIFLEDKPNWANQTHTQRDFVDAKVIITDFGNAIMPMAFGYEDTGVGNQAIYQNVNRRIEGSFRSLPPEIFSNPINTFSYNPGSGEAWAIGILFYKLLMGQDILNIQSISEYANIVCTNEIESTILSKLPNIYEILNHNYILIMVIEGLLKVKASQRMSLGVAAGLLWDYRFGDLNEKSSEFQKNYIDAGRSYPPMRPDEYDCY